MCRPLQPPDIDHFMSPGSRRGPAALRVDPRRGRPGQDQMLFCKLATVLLEGIRRLSYIDLLNSPCSSSPIKMRFPVLRPMARITTSRSAAYPAAGVPGIPQLDYRRALLMVSTEAIAGPDNVRSAGTGSACGSDGGPNERRAWGVGREQVGCVANGVRRKDAPGR